MVQGAKFEASLLSKIRIQKKLLRSSGMNDTEMAEQNEQVLTHLIHQSYLSTISTAQSKRTRASLPQRLLLPHSKDSATLKLQQELKERKTSIQAQKFQNVLEDCDVPCIYQFFPRATGGPKDGVVQVQGKDRSYRFVRTTKGLLESPYTRFRSRETVGVSSTSLRSEIPISLYSPIKHHIQHQAVNSSSARPSVRISLECKNNPAMDDIILSLREHIQVEVENNCIDEASRMENTHSENQVLFELVVESENTSDHITDKLWESLSSGALPVYFGAPNAADHIPQDWFIDMNKFESVSQLGLYLQFLTTNLTAYEDYHAWRQKPIPLNFLEHYSSLEIPEECRMCRWVYAKSFHLGWSHAEQSIIWEEHAEFQTPDSISTYRGLGKYDSTGLPYKHFNLLKQKDNVHNQL